MAAPRTGSLGVATTKADLYVINANGDLERLPVGADDQILVADSADPLGVAWKDPGFAANASFQADAVDAVFRQINLGAGAIANPAVQTRGTHSILAFLATALRGIPWQKFMPTDYSGGDIRVTISWVSDGVDVGNAVLGAAFERDNVGFDIDADGFAAVKSVTTAAPGVAGQIVESVITFTNAEADGIVAGEPLRIFVQRDGADVADTLTDQLLLVRVVVEEVQP